MGAGIESCRQNIKYMPVIQFQLKSGRFVCVSCGHRAEKHNLVIDLVIENGIGRFICINPMEETAMYSDDQKTFTSGFTRKPVKEAFHLVCPELERRVALICSEGLKRYKDPAFPDVEMTTARNPGPLDNLVKHMKRHLNLWLSGDRTEDHLAKVGWAVQQIMHQEDPACQHYDMYLPADRSLIKK